MFGFDDYEKRLIARTFQTEAKEFYSAENLAKEDFADPHLGAIWEEVKATYKAAWTYTDLLDPEPWKRLGAKARSYFYELALAETEFGKTNFFAQEIKAEANLRHAKRIATLANEMTLENKTQALQEIRHLETLLETNPETQKPKTREERAVAWVNGLVEEPNFLATGSPSLDEFLGGGFEKGNFYILAARPAVGKTAVALNLAWLLQDRAKTCFYSLEMGENQIQARLAAIATAWQHNRIKPKADPQTLEKVAKEYLPKFLATGLDIIHEPAGFSMNSFRAHALRQKAEGNLDFLVIDQLDKIRGDKEFRGGDYERFTAHSSALKQLALELEVPLLLLCQINREGNEAPALTHLKSSGQLEQDADLVFLLDRKGDPNLGECDLILNVAKNRHGKTGLIRYRWQGDTLRLTDPATQTYIPDSFFTAGSSNNGQRLSAGTAI